MLVHLWWFWGRTDRWGRIRREGGCEGASLRATVIIRYSLTCTALSTAFSPVRVRKRRPIRRLTWALERVKESPQAAGEWAYCSGAGKSHSTRVRKVAWAQE